MYMYMLTRVSTREVVLQRDGINVVQSGSCAAVSGTWVSPYDGATWTDAADVVCAPSTTTTAAAAGNIE